MHEEPIDHLDRRLGGFQLDLDSVKRKKTSFAARE